MKFIVLGQQSAITYKDVFPLLRDRRVRLGAWRLNRDMFFDVPDPDVLVREKKGGSAWKLVDGAVLGRLASSCWFTNLRHDVRRRLPPLRTMAENLATNKRLRKHLLEKYGRLEYPRYDNYAAIEVPFVDAIPSDYDGVMGVPVTFLDKWDPDGGAHGMADQLHIPYIGGAPIYSRLLIHPRHELVDANDYRVSDSVPCKPHGLVKDKEAAVDGRPTYCRLLIRPAGV